MDGAKEVSINTDYIKLDAFLKFSALAETGSEAKMMIRDGQVRVNGEACTQRGKKLRDGDTVSVGGQSLTVREEKNAGR